MRLNNLQEAEAELAKYIPLARKITGKDITLQRMRPIMESLGNPQDSLKIIHVAGTSGKTSTAYYIAEMLRLSGQKVGLTVSPHTSLVTERIQVNGKSLAQSEFCKKLAIFLRKIQASPIQPTYFELLVAFAYWYFAGIKVDYAIAETGLGGLHDATNIANLPNKVCVITDIGLDHTHVLGNTIGQIAEQKAGIIQAKNQAIMHSQTKEILKVFQHKANKQRSKLKIIDSNSTLALTDLPAYQQRNWLLAKEAFDFIARRDGLGLLDFKSCKQSQRLIIPGRMEKLIVGKHSFILDGAHNQQKTEALVASFMARNQGGKATIVLSLKQDKAYKDVLQLLKPISGTLIVTEFSRAQDLPVKPFPASDLAKFARDIGFSTVIIEPDAPTAIKLASGLSTDTVLITGSLYLVGEVRKLLNEN